MVSPMPTATSTDQIAVILKYLSRATPKGRLEEAELLEVMRWLQRLSVSQNR